MLNKLFKTGNSVLFPRLPKLCRDISSTVNQIYWSQENIVHILKSGGIKCKKIHSIQSLELRILFKKYGQIFKLKILIWVFLFLKQVNFIQEEYKLYGQYTRWFTNS